MRVGKQWSSWHGSPVAKNYTVSSSKMMIVSQAWSYRLTFYKTVSQLIETETEKCPPFPLFWIALRHSNCNLVALIFPFSILTTFPIRVTKTDSPNLSPKTPKKLTTKLSFLDFPFQKRRKKVRKTLKKGNCPKKKFTTQNQLSSSFVGSFRVAFAEPHWKM